MTIEALHTGLEYARLALSEHDAIESSYDSDMISATFPFDSWDVGPTT